MLHVLAVPFLPSGIRSNLPVSLGVIMIAANPFIADVQNLGIITFLAQSIGTRFV